MSKQKTIGIIGDPHASYLTFLALIEKTKHLCDEWIVAGDIIDRGNGSMQLIDYIKNNPKITSVKGNHEDMLIEDYNIRSTKYGHLYSHLYLCNGGQETLNSYMVKSHLEEDGTIYTDPSSNKTLDEHVKWLDSLPYFIERKDIVREDGRHLLVTHTSASFVWHWNEEKRLLHSKAFNHSLTWNRKPSIKNIPTIFNIFGHTPIKVPKITQIYANVDTGAVFKNIPGYGNLTCLIWPTMQIVKQKNIDNSDY